MGVIKTIDFISKLGDAYFVAYNTLAIMKRGEIKNHIVNTMTQGIEGMLSQFMVNKDGTRIDAAGADAEFFKVVKSKFVQDAARKIDNYEVIFLNQNLVMQCTIMEIFFLHILEIILETNPKIIIRLSPEKIISLERVVSLKKYDAIIDNFKSKIYDDFSWGGIKDKFDIYKKIDLEIRKVFDFSAYTENIRKLFKGYGLPKLIEIFDKRHSIVHRNMLPIKSLEELTKIKDYFEKIILNLSTVAMDKYGILLDFQDNLVKSGYPRERIPVKQHEED